MWKLNVLKNVFGSHVNIPLLPSKKPVAPIQPATVQSKPVQKEYVHVEAVHGSLIISSSKPWQASSHVALKFAFCCLNHNGKFLAKNHASYLYDCEKSDCRNCLVKLPIDVLN